MANVSMIRLCTNQLAFGVLYMPETIRNDIVDDEILDKPLEEW